MSLENCCELIDLKGLIVLVVRTGMSLAGTARLARMAKWSDKAGKV